MRNHDPQENSHDPRAVPDCGLVVRRTTTGLVGSLAMGILLTKRRAVDLCRVAACLCRPVC
ncbi:Ms5788A family Cys-rich leader peptide [Hamadaea flava]|uniref:Ms5788A family Cys-rich leader peptide n=1 Tax=Hamadaea flava TaxID=1742688 RepID=A0ABV8LHP6_9ACTN